MKNFNISLILVSDPDELFSLRFLTPSLISLTVKGTSLFTV